MTITLPRRRFLQLLGMGATAAAAAPLVAPVEHVRRIWQVGANAPVGALGDPWCRALVEQFRAMREDRERFPDLLEQHGRRFGKSAELHQLPNHRAYVGVDYGHGDSVSFDVLQQDERGKLVLIARGTPAEIERVAGKGVADAARNTLRGAHVVPDESGLPTGRLFGIEPGKLRADERARQLNADPHESGWGELPRAHSGFSAEQAQWIAKLREHYERDTSKMHPAEREP